MALINSRCVSMLRFDQVKKNPELKRKNVNPRFLQKSHRHHAQITFFIRGRGYVDLQEKRSIFSSHSSTARAMKMEDQALL